MKILHVVSTLAPSSGGPTNVLRGLAIAQSKAGNDITIATTNRSNPVNQILPPKHFDTFAGDDVAVRAFPVAFAPLLASPAMARWLRRNVRQFDVVHVHGVYRFPPTYAAYEARRQGVPYIVRPHGSLDPYLYEKSSHGPLILKRLYEYLFDLPNLRSASAIHYTSEDERAHAAFLNLGAADFVLPNGLDWARYMVLPERGGLRRCLNFGDEPLVLFVGRLHSSKGFDLLLPAFDSVLRAVPSARLVVCGPDNDGFGSRLIQWTRELGIAAKVHFVGALHGEQLLQAYVDADAFVLPSYTESFGMTVIEAMACSAPVVITDRVKIHSEVARARAGAVTRCDSKELAAALVALLNEPDRRHAMGEAGRALVQRRYQWPAIVEELNVQYEAAIQRRGRRARGLS